MTTGITVLQWTVYSDCFNLLIDPERSGVCVEGLEKTWQKGIQEYEHDSHKGPFFGFDHDNQSESNYKNKDWVYQNGGYEQ